MNGPGNLGFDNLATMQERLRKIEEFHIPEGHPDLQQARNGLINPAIDYRRNSFAFGRALWIYRKIFKAHQGWMEAAQVIADEVGASPRTLFRVIADYERAQGLSPAFAAELIEEQIDPAARKNAGMVNQLVRMPAPATIEEARAVVTTVIQKNRTRKAATGASAHKSHRREPLDRFTSSIVGQFTDRFGGVPSQEKTEQVLRVLRSVLAALNIPVEMLLGPPGPKPASTSRLSISA